MDYVKPADVVENMSNAGADKSRLSIRDILIKGALSGAFLGFATTLAFTGAVQTKLDIVGAFIFPVGFVMILLLNLELVTGNFAMIPMAVMRSKTNMPRLVHNFSWAFLGNLLGGLFYALLFAIVITKFWHTGDGEMIQKIIKVGEAKTLAYKEYGMDGMIVGFIKAILCNWMVTLGAVMAFTSQSTVGKIAAMWLPVFTFFGLGFEHAVVNMFVLPAGLLVGAEYTFSDWWLWNQIPVTIGNLLGGFLLTGLTLHLVYKKPQRTTNVQDSVGSSKDSSAL